MSKNRESLAYYAENMKPAVASLLELLHLNKIYLKGEGAYLTHRPDGEEQPILDFISGYGSGLLGHNHAVVRAETERLWQTSAPDNAWARVSSMRRSAAYHSSCT